VSFREEDLVFFVGVEGACDFYAGRPFDLCPYVRRNAEAAWRSWREGWLAASAFERTRGQIERERWWGRAA